jgi:carboxymethylenebutenolidase
LPAVVVVHENRGLNPYIEDVARRLAKAGFIALAPDGLTSVGGYPGNDEKGVALQQTVDPTKLMNDFFAAIEWLMHHDSSTGKVGITGFCYGGGVTNAAAVAYPELGAAVSFYGRQPEAKDVPKIKAPIMLHYAELDTRINEGWPAYEKALKAAGTPMRPISTRAPTTVSTMTRRRAMTRRRRIWRGSAPWDGCANTRPEPDAQALIFAISVPGHTGGNG